jgi:hypothetical protein
MASAVTSQMASGVGYRGRVFTAALFAVLGAAAADPVTAPRAQVTAQTAVPLRGVTMSITLDVHAKNGEMAASRVSASRRISVGDEYDGRIGAGTFTVHDLCDAKVTPGDDLYMTWRVRATLRSASSERIEFDLSWTRTTAGLGVTAEGNGTVAIPPGRSHLIDIVATDPAENRRCTHVGLRITADRANPSWGGQFAHRLWLVHEQGGNRSVSDPLDVVGDEGESLAFRFRPLRWTASGAPAMKTQASLLDIEVWGTILSEPTDGGNITTAVLVRRGTRTRHGSSSGSGTMVMVGPPGEAGELELPQFRGKTTVFKDEVPPGPLSRALTPSGEDYRVDLSQFFAGSRTSLVIEVERTR